MGGAVYFYNELTDGFSVRQMSSTLPYNVLFEVGPLPVQEKTKLTTILDQPFHYIGKGCQFYAFESEDGQYVIKFLKQKHLKLWTELNQIPMPKSLRDKADAKIVRRKNRVANLFSSCKLAYEEMAEESGLLFIHLNRTAVFNHRVTLIDNLGLKHHVPVDKYEFVIQKKAVRAADALAQIAKCDDMQALEQRVTQLVELVKMRCEKGIRDRDRSFVQNVAFMPDHALFIDIGQFYKDPTILLEEEQQKEVAHRLANLRYWVEERHPEMLESLDLIIKEHLEI